MTDKTFWFLTVMNGPHDKDYRKRTWGFFDNFEEAEQAVMMNDADIWECEYDYAVLEEHYMGTLAMGTGKMSWYKYNRITEMYEKIDKPEWSKNVCHWGIG